MPLRGWLVLVVSVVLAGMWLYDRRVRARGGRLNDPGSMARGVTAPQASPDAHRSATPDRGSGV